VLYLIVLLMVRKSVFDMDHIIYSPFRLVHFLYGPFSIRSIFDMADFWYSMAYGPYDMEFKVRNFGILTSNKSMVIYKPFIVIKVSNQIQ